MSVINYFLKQKAPESSVDKRSFGSDAVGKAIEIMRQRKTYSRFHRL